jgi:hypothetical protein
MIDVIRAFAEVCREDSAPNFRWWDEAAMNLGWLDVCFLWVQLR